MSSIESIDHLPPGDTDHPVASRRLIDNTDWPATALGPRSTWPQSLRTSLELMLPARAPMALFWGPDGIVFYNDSYAATLGGLHPRAFGRPAAESSGTLAPLLAEVRRSAVTMTGIEFRGDAGPALSCPAYSPVRDESGAVGGVLCTLNPFVAEPVVTRLALDVISEGVYSIDTEGNITLCNARFLQLLGYTSAAEVVGRKLYGEIDPLRSDRSGDASHSPVHLAATTGKPGYVSGELFYRTDGSSFPVEYRAQPIWLDGELQGAVCTFVDISERLQQQTALLQSEAARRGEAERIELALNAGAVVGTWVWDIVRDRITADAAFARAFSLDAEQLRRGLPVAEARQPIHPEDLATFQAAMDSAVALGGPFRAEYRVRRSDGSWMWVETHGHVEHDAEGRPKRFPGVLIDIDDRKRAEDKTRAAIDARRQVELDLAETHQQFQLAQVAGGIGVFSLSLADNVLTVSPEFCHLFGLPPTETLASSLVESLFAGPGKHTMATADPASAESRDGGASELQTEYCIRRADSGKLRWIARRGEYVRDVSGRPTAMRGVVQDITARKVAELSLRESKARFKALTQALPNQVWTATADGSMDWFNDKVYAYSGRVQSELLGSGWSRIVHPDDLPRAALAWAQALASGNDYQTEFRICGRNGRYRWFIIRALPVQGEDGVLRWIGTNTDIEEQKAAQSELARLNVSLEERVEERTRERDRMWHLSTDIMLVARFDGTIHAVNPAWKLLLGWGESDLVGASLFDFVHEEDLAETAREAARLGAGLTTLRFENRYRHRDGSYRAIAWTAVPGDVFLHAVGRDITAKQAADLALRDTEDQLRQSQKMEAVGQLTGGIAHDFNNLLQGITGSLEVVKKRIAQGRPGEVDRFISGAISAAHRAAALTHRLLAFSRRQPLDPKPVRANPLVGSMEDLLRRTLGEHVGLEMVLAGGLWLTLCDPNQLENALLNLAINARDAMPGGGKLVIETGNAHLDGTYAADAPGLIAGQYVCIAVTDSGTGMAPEVVKRAFDPFFTTKPQGEGTGLGLSMIYGFALQSEGFCKIYSEPGNGTTVKLYLPRHRGTEAVPGDLPFEPEARPTVRSEVVLVVEDEQVVRSLVVDALNELGYQTLEAADGPSGLAILLSGQHVDLLVTDMGLPGMNGRQLTDTARLSRPELKVLFMTGYAENAARAHGFLEPGMAMITKPFGMATLTMRVQELIQMPAPRPATA